MWYETLLAEFSFGLLGIVAAMQSSEESISAQSNSDNKTLRPTCSTIAAYTLLLQHKSNRNTNLTFMSLILYSFLYWGKKKIEFDLNGFETKCSLCNIVTLLLWSLSLASPKSLPFIADKEFDSNTTYRLLWDFNTFYFLLHCHHLLSISVAQNILLYFDTFFRQPSQPI